MLQSIFGVLLIVFLVLGGIVTVAGLLFSDEK